MPPRKDKVDEDKDSQANRLRDRAVKKGILAESQPAAPDVPLPLSRALLKLNGLDILKKSTTRKNRYLLILNCLLAPATSGKLGSLANLDSQEPCMYIDFPQGRLKLFGTLVFPRNKYLLLRTGGQQGVMCEDVFENMIVFSESWWVGTAEENPEERQLPLPAELSTTTIHSDYDFAYGASYTGGGKAGKVASSQQDPPSQQGLGSQQVVMSQQGPSQEQPGSALRPRRAAAQKSYQGLAPEDEDDNEEMEEDEEGEEEGGPGRPIAGAARAIRPLQHDPIEILSTEDPDEAKEQGRSRQGGRGSFDLEAKQPKQPTPRKRAAAPKRTFKDASSDEENDDEEEEEEGTHGSEEDGSPFDGSEDGQPKRPKPAARKPAAAAARARKQPAGNARSGPQSPTKRQRADPNPMQRPNQYAPQHKRGKAKSNALGAKENGSDNEDDDVAGERLGSEEQAGGSDDEDGDGGEGVLSAAEKRAAAAAAASGPRPTRSPRRAAAKRITYAESDDDEEEGEEEVEEEGEDDDDGGDSDEAFGGGGAGEDGDDSGDGDQHRRKRPAATQRRGRGGGTATRAAPRKKTKQASPEVFVIDSDDD